MSETRVDSLSAGDNDVVQILLVEDDPAIASVVKQGLVDSGHDVEHVATGRGALSRVEEQWDCILLDLGLPDIDGLDVCREIRAASTVPIIILTARSDELDRVVGLEVGADDYVVKPFGMRELIARIRAVTRRSGRGDSHHDSDTITVGTLVIDEPRRTVSLDGRELALTPKEFDLLVHLAREPGVVHRRHDILEQVWDTEWYGPTKTLDAHVAALRKKLGDQDWIEAVRGVGFRLKEPSV